MPQKTGTKTVQKRKKAKSTTKTNISHSKRSVKSDNLETSLFSSISTQINCQKSKQKYRSTLSNTRTVQDAKLALVSKENQNNFEIPKNVAVHFGNYYGLNGSSGENKSQHETKTSLRDARYSAYSHVKSPFTRQMVCKLENSAGKQYYAKEVAALLEETVEPANFKINPPPAENSIPNDKAEPSFPLWYREPNKMLLSEKGEYRHPKENDDKLTSYFSKYKSKNAVNHSKVFKQEKEEKNYEGLGNLEGESGSEEEESTRTREKEARGYARLSESASCSESAANSNLTSGWTTVTGKSASGSTCTMESASDSKGDDDGSASSSLSRSLANADNESQGVNVPVVAHSRPFANPMNLQSCI